MWVFKYLLMVILSTPMSPAKATMDLPRSSSILLCRSLTNSGFKLSSKSLRLLWDFLAADGSPAPSAKLPFAANSAS